MCSILSHFFVDYSKSIMTTKNKTKKYHFFFKPTKIVDNRLGLTPTNVASCVESSTNVQQVAGPEPQLHDWAPSERHLLSDGGTSSKIVFPSLSEKHLRRLQCFNIAFSYQLNNNSESV